MPLPIELTIDKYHPDNQGYMQSVNRTKQLLVTAQMQCRTRDVEIAKRHIKGQANKDIAEQLDISPNMVYAALKRPPTIELLELLRHYEALWEGPSIQQVRGALWEINVDNKAEDPKTSIAALKEINHMNGTGREKHQDQQINININTNDFPKGSLDV